MKYRFIGHCFDPVENHDKVWGVIYLQPEKVKSSWGGLSWSKCLTFWGRRGKKLSTKISIDNSELAKLIYSKENKGYQSINKDRLDEVYPEFESDLEKTAMWEILKL